LGFTATDVNPFPQELTFFVFLPAQATAGQPQRTDVPPAKPPVSLIWEYYSVNGWARLNVFADETLAFTREGFIRIQQPARIVPYKIDPLDPQELLWIRARIDGPTYLPGKAPQIDIMRPNTVKVVNLSTDRNRVLGIALGHPGEIFDLTRRPVEPTSVVIQVEGSADTWLRKDDFLASKKDDPHFVVNATAGTIQFGDGEHGRIPPAGATIIATQFRYGGGARGNLALAGSIKDMVSSPSGIEKAMNERNAVGGAEEQNIDDIIAEGPQILRRRERAVTPDDFASFAKEIDGVKNAVAIPLRHPDFPGVDVPGAVTVYIVPDTTERPPKASGALIRSVADRLNEVRLLTTEVYVSSPYFNEIRVETRLDAPPYVSFDTVAKNARQALDNLLDPQTWKFGKDLFPTDIDRALLEVKDVRAIQNRNVFVNGRLQISPFEAVPTPDGGLVYGAGHIIIVTPEEDR
jgi:predicted phage baseplate assembly protein